MSDPAKQPSPAESEKETQAYLELMELLESLKKLNDSAMRVEIYAAMSLWGKVSLAQAILKQIGGKKGKGPNLFDIKDIIQ